METIVLLITSAGYEDDLMKLYTEFRPREARAEDPMLAFLAELPSDTNRLERMLALEQNFS